MAKRFITRIELSVESREKLTALSKTSGISQVRILSRLVGWMTDQPDLVQAMILQQIPKSIEREAAVLFLSRLAKQSQTG